MAISLSLANWYSRLLCREPQSYYGRGARCPYSLTVENDMSLLEFEHIIHINDPREPQLPTMSRAHLWEGLLFRTKYPGHFNPTLSTELENLSATGFIRHLRFGTARLRDVVTLDHEREIQTRSEGLEGQMFARSVTRIEEPGAGHMLVRFYYCRDSGNVQGGLDVDSYLKAAYLQNDREAVVMLRRFALEGLPGTGSWLQ